MHSHHREIFAGQVGKKILKNSKVFLLFYKRVPFQTPEIQRAFIEISFLKKWYRNPGEIPREETQVVADTLQATTFSVTMQIRKNK